MPVSEKQKKYADKYIKNTFDEIKLRVPKGKKAEIKEFAESHGESVNAFLNRITNEAMGIDEESEQPK